MPLQIFVIITTRKILNRFLSIYPQLLDSQIFLELSGEDNFSVVLKVY